MIEQMLNAKKIPFIMSEENTAACSWLYSRLEKSFRKQSILRCFDLINRFGIGRQIKNSDIVDFLGITSAGASQLLQKLCKNGCMRKNDDHSYSFICE